jgi:electron transport complex protein RnfG
MLAAGALLALAALLGTGLLSWTQQHAEPYIEANERHMLLRSLNAVLDAGSYDNAIVSDTLEVRAPEWLGSAQPAHIYRARLKGRPVGAVLSVVAPDGYGGPINLLVGVRYDGTVSGVRVISHRETPGLGDRIEARRSNWIDGFTGKSLDNPAPRGWKVRRDGGEFDQFTGATITPRAVVNAVHNSLRYFSDNRAAIFNTKQTKQGAAGADRSGEQRDE